MKVSPSYKALLKARIKVRKFPKYAYRFYKFSLKEKSSLVLYAQDTPPEHSESAYVKSKEDLSSIELKQKLEAAQNELLKLKVKMTS